MNVQHDTARTHVSNYRGALKPLVMAAVHMLIDDPFTRSELLMFLHKSPTKDTYYSPQYINIMYY